MSKASIIAFVFGAMLFGCGAGMVAHEYIESKAAAQQTWTGNKWEYMCFRYGNNPWHLNTQEGMDKLTEKGYEGWELVALALDGEGVWASACFKRPIQ